MNINYTFKINRINKVLINIKIFVEIQYHYYNNLLNNFQSISITNGKRAKANTRTYEPV